MISVTPWLTKNNRVKGKKIGCDLTKSGQVASMIDISSLSAKNNWQGHNNEIFMEIPTSFFILKFSGLLALFFNINSSIRVLSGSLHNKISVDFSFLTWFYNMTRCRVHFKKFLDFFIRLNVSCPLFKPWGIHGYQWLSKTWWEDFQGQVLSLFSNMVHDVLVKPLQKLFNSFPFV